MVITSGEVVKLALVLCGTADGEPAMLIASGAVEKVSFREPFAAPAPDAERSMTSDAAVNCRDVLLEGSAFGPKLIASTFVCIVRRDAAPLAPVPVRSSARVTVVIERLLRLIAAVPA